MSISIKKIAIFGATSDIATAVARAAISPGVEFFLAARNEQDVARCAQDLKTRGASRVETKQFNATAFHDHQQLVSEAWNSFGGFDLILIAHGALVDAKKAFEDFKTAQSGFEVNALSVFSLASAFLPHCS